MASTSLSSSDMPEEDMQTYDTSQDPTQESEPSVSAQPIQALRATSAISKGIRLQKVHARLEVWDHFTREINPDGLNIGKCKYCDREIQVDLKSNDTFGLRNHITICKKWPYSIIHQGELNFKVDGENDKVCTRRVWKFDQKAIEHALARMIIVDGLPFKFIESEGFKHFMSVACPRFKIPSRFAIARDCFQLYLDKKLKLKKLLQKSVQRVSLTIDRWTSLQSINYIRLTTHYIDDEWRLNKKVLNFCPVSDHSGSDLGMAIETCLLDWGIDRVFSVTVDNSLSNDIAMSYLKDKILSWGSSIAHGKYIHIRCIAHTINLIVNDGLKEIDRSVSKIRHSILYIKQSPSRLKNFKKCVEIEKIQTKCMLCLDVSTRWDSTYLMLDDALKFERAFERFKVFDPNFCHELMMEDGTNGVPDSKDWDDVRRVIKFLENFYYLILKTSDSLNETSNIFFDEITIIDKLFTKLQKSEDSDLSIMAHIMREKYDEYWGDTLKTNKLIYIAAVLDPRFRFKYVENELCILYENEMGMTIAKEVKVAMFEMFNEYKRMNASHEGLQSIENAQPEAINVGDSNESENFREAEMRRKRERKKKCRSEFGGIDSRTELDKYISEESEDDSDDFDVLSWWKVNSFRFPLLSQMARDVLAVPISTVAVESAFSTGNQILDPFRSSLSPNIVQALICAQDWLRRSPPINIEETIEDIEKIESEFSTKAMGSIGVDI